MDADSLARKIKRKKRRTRDKVDSEMRTSANRIRSAARRNIVDSDAVWTTQLFRSIEVDKRGWASYAVGTDVPYAAYVEFGTGSKNVADDPEFQFEAPEFSQALVGAIVEWVMTKPGFRRERTLSNAYKIAGSIAAEGTEDQPFLGPAYRANKRRTLASVRTAVRRGLRT
jgi:HK97 gp10 family phage protein